VSGKRLVGMDKHGNKYFELAEPNQHQGGGVLGKRTVEYVGDPEPTQIPIIWYQWLHYRRSRPPSQAEYLHFEAQQERMRLRIQEYEANEERIRMQEATQRELVDGTSTGKRAELSLDAFVNQLSAKVPSSGPQHEKDK